MNPWRSFVARTWGREPGKAVLASSSASSALLSLDDVFALAVVAAAPFVDGTRFSAVPDVRFFSSGSRLRAPGSRLPSPADRSLARYLARQGGQHSGRGFQLLITSPFVLDFSLWSRTRAILRGLVDEIGVPVLPLATELLIGTWSGSPEGTPPRRHHAALTLVLSGELTSRLQPPSSGSRTKRASKSSSRASAGGRALSGRPGEALYWPADYQHDDSARDCAALRIWIPTEGARVAEAVRDVATALLDRRLPQDQAVPYVPLPPARAAKRGDAGSPAPALHAAALLDELASGEELTRAMQIQWAKRVSSLGLEPVPAALAEPRLTDRDAVELVAAPLRMPVSEPDGDERDELSIWAVHGHAFSVRDESIARSLIVRLAAGPVRVAQLPTIARPTARAMLRTLLRLRAARLALPSSPSASSSAPPSHARRGARRR